MRLVIRVGRIVFVFLGVGVWVRVVILVSALSGHSTACGKIVVGDSGDVLVVEFGDELVSLHSGRRVGRGSVVGFLQAGHEYTHMVSARVVGGK